MREEDSKLFRYFKYSNGIMNDEWQSREGYIARRIQDSDGISYVVESPRGNVYHRRFAKLPTALRFILKKQGDL